jgi:hypothetical protein
MNIMKLVEISPYRISDTMNSNVEVSPTIPNMKPINICEPPINAVTIINLPDMPFVSFQLSLNAENTGLSFNVASKSANPYLAAKYKPGMINAIDPTRTATP